MVENKSIRETFDQCATDGYLGDPKGELAYNYIRVSTAQQAEDGRSGLPRQIEHCHEMALAHHLKIPWEMVFADDGSSGFEFENRPALSRLREEIKTKPRSRYVVIEHLDRLSRNARWHQGFLLEEFTRHHITPIFWKAFSSEIERAVLGTIAEEGMRSEITRMMEGMRMKARSGRVTAKHPRFGYRFVDSEGKTGEKARQDTHYALDPEKAKIVRWMFDQVLDEHKSMGRIAIEMNEKKIPVMRAGAFWCPATVNHIVRDPVYKGEFYAHRWYREETGEISDRGRPRGIMRQRPKEEWIKVAVPAIVSPEEWDLAQTMVTANQKHATRNTKKYDWLLSSFMRCDLCHYSLCAVVGGSPERSRPIRYYGCISRANPRALAKNAACHSPYVHADKLEAFVWEKLEAIVTDPGLLLGVVEEEHQAQQRNEEEEHLKYLEEKISEVAARYERWKQAYEASVIPLSEYDGYRHQFHNDTQDLLQEKEKAQRKLGHRLSLAQQKKMVLSRLARLRQRIERGENGVIPFALKRQLLEQLVDCIWVNSEKKTIRIEGGLNATYEEEDTGFVFSSSHTTENKSGGLNIPFSFIFAYE